MKAKGKKVEKGENRHYLLISAVEPSPSGHPRGVLASTSYTSDRLIEVWLLNR